MQPVNKLANVQSGINVTPLVDVVLVLLIIFMLVAPELQSDAAVTLPKTDRPQDQPDDGRQIVVLIEADGSLWIDDDRVNVEQFPQRIREAAAERDERQVVIKGDARLTFGDVQSAMFAIEAAGFQNVGLIAERRNDSRPGG